jgi:hypothetical protein
MRGGVFFEKMAAEQLAVRGGSWQLRLAGAVVRIACGGSFAATWRRVGGLFFQKKENHALPQNLPSFDNLVGWVDATSGVSTGFFLKRKSKNLAAPISARKGQFFGHTSAFFSSDPEYSGSNSKNSLV